MAAAIAIIARLPLLAVLVGAAACGSEDQAPRTFIAGPRVLAIKAEPPEVAAGGSTTVTILVVGTQGSATVAHAAAAPLPGRRATRIAHQPAGARTTRPSAREDDHHDDARRHHGGARATRRQRPFDIGGADRRS
jgi:hypothetical protein